MPKRELKSKMRKAAHHDFPRKIKVAIVGGGCAGMAAAWHLAKLPDAYEVHVYEKSFRLGGKGASGRDKDGHIIEHGLHVWLGFYENAFRMIRECYAIVREKHWGPKCKNADGVLAHGSFEEAFIAEPNIGVSIRGNGQPWQFWSGMFPPTAGTPGDDLHEDDNPFTLSNYMWRCFLLLRTLFQSVVAGPGEATEDEKVPPNQKRPTGRSALDEAVETDLDYDPMRNPAPVVDAIARYLRTGALASAAGLKQALRVLEQWTQRMNQGPGAAQSTLNLIEAVAAQMRKQLRDAVAVDPDLRWKTEVIDIVMAITVGLYRDRLLFSEEGLDAINHLDYKEWLKSNGADERSVESQFINGIYDLTFAYRDGDRRQPQLAAGVALRGALRMFFTYRGAMFWRMRSGMGDAVFAPLYRVLKDKGVRFHFNWELTGVAMVRDDRRDRLVDNLTFQAPADDSGSGLDKFGCWPHEFKTPRQAKKTLANGSDFDAVIFAMGLDDFRGVFRDNTSMLANKRQAPVQLPDDWKDALQYGASVATRSAQLWHEKDLMALGWKRGSGLVTGIDAPAFQTWADMTHTLPSERAWREKHAVRRLPPSHEAKTVAYFCGVIHEDPADAKKMELARSHENIRSQFHFSLANQMREMWPGFQPGSTLAQTGLHQHVQVNAKGSDRYTLSLPGTIGYRISPLDNWVANMSVAGDWTACGLDAGCVESAVMSGMLACHAITNVEPRLESIIGYDHP